MAKRVGSLAGCSACFVLGLAVGSLAVSSPMSAVSQASSSVQPQAAGEAVILRYLRIKKGSLPDVYRLSADSIWPYYERAGVRVQGLWQVMYPALPGQTRHESDEYDEAYLLTRYASLEHWHATRESEIAAAAPCTTATETCTEWMTVEGGSKRVLLYRTHALHVTNATVTRALIMVHGGGRNADDYYRSALAAGFLAGALGDTIIIAPRFSSSTGNRCRDTLSANELNWPCTWESSGALSTVDWRTGSLAIGSSTITSFDIADELIRSLANRATFPNMRAIVVAGHSGGAFFVSRYAIASQIHDRVGVPISYVVANAGAYPYLDNLRPSASIIPATIANAPWSLALASAVATPAFATFTGNCGTYDSWPYGLQHRTGYAGRLAGEQLKRQLVGRSITYLLGQLDTIMIPSVFDESCAAAAQGSNHLARGLAWSAYVRERHGAEHQTWIVPSCGHNERCMFTADVAQPVLFPKK